MYTKELKKKLNKYCKEHNIEMDEVGFYPDIENLTEYIWVCGYNGKIFKIVVNK